MSDFEQKLVMHGRQELLKIPDFEQYLQKKEHFSENLADFQRFQDIFGDARSTKMSQNRQKTPIFDKKEPKIAEFSRKRAISRDF